MHRAGSHTGTGYLGIIPKSEMEEKMKPSLTLTGTTTVSKYTCNPPGSMGPTRTTGEITLPGKLILVTTDESCLFSFTDYPAISENASLDAPHPERRRGMFDLSTAFDPVYISKRIDNSGIRWRAFHAKGHLHWKGKTERFIEFSMSMPDGSTDLSIWANWPQRAYPRAPLEMDSKSTILDLDEKSLKKFNAMWDEMEEGK